jgi:hypothetical protein
MAIPFLVLFLNAGGILSVQKAAPATHRYFRLICLVHLTGSGKAGDPIVPEYVAEGTAAARAAVSAIPTTLAIRPDREARPKATAVIESSRQGIVAWSMQKTITDTLTVEPRRCGTKLKY